MKTAINTNIKNTFNLNILIIVTILNIFIISPIHFGGTRIPLTLITAIFGFILLIFHLSKVKKFYINKVDVILLAFLFVNSISIILNNYRFEYLKLTESINGFIVLTAGIFYYFYLRISIKKFNQVILLFKVYYFSSLIPITYSLIHFLLWQMGYPFLFKINYDLYQRFYNNGWFFRVSGFAPEPSHYAIYLSSVFFIGLYFFYKKEKKSKVYNITLLFVFLTLLLTFSQILIIDSLFMLWLLFIKGKKAKKNVGLIFIFITVILSIIILNSIFRFDVTEIIYSRLLNVKESGKNYNIGRVQSFIIGWRIFLRYPFIGIGINNLTNNMIQNIAGLTYYEKHIGIHSMFMKILMESGIIGLLIYLLFIIKSTIKNLRFKCLINMPNRITFSFFITFILMSLTGAFPTFFFYWFLAALSVSYNSLEGKS